MALDVAQTAWSFFLFSMAEVLYILIPMAVFWLQKKDLKYEFRHRIIPNERLHTPFKVRILEIIIGLAIGTGFYFLGNLMTRGIRLLIVTWMGDDFYQNAVDGAVNTTPPPPPPNPALIWLLIIIGIVLYYSTVAVSEEFCYRGVIMKEIGHKSKFWAVAVSSLIFAVYHVFPGIVPWATFFTFFGYYFVFGVLLAVITIYQRGDLIIAIVAHGTLNSIIWAIRYIQFLP